MSYKSNHDLEREYDEHMRHSRHFQADKVSNTLKRRGYFHHENEDEYDGGSGGYSSSSSSSGSFFIMPSFVGIGLVFFFIAAAYQCFKYLPIGMYTEAVLPFYHDILLDLRPSFPLGESYSQEVIKTKLLLPVYLLGVAYTFLFMFGLLSLFTVHSVRVRYMTVPFATFVLLFSFYMVYSEYSKGDAGIFSVFMFFVTFLVSLYPIKRLKKNWKMGLYIIIMSTLGFLIMGNDLLAPYLCLTTAGSILLFTRGYFWGIGHNE
ncbi:hypothetical protein CN918_31020 [Priestia megaterium]|nr:hypothetical protein CN918_31020 [Priestia megaterium]